MSSLTYLVGLTDLSQILPSGEGDIVGMIIQMLFILLFVFTMFYGQRMQSWTMLRHIDSSLKRLKVLKDEARRITIETLKGSANLDRDITPDIDRFLEYFWIPPNNVDPVGIIPKIEHLLNVRDERSRNEIKALVPSADEAQISNLENLIEYSLFLNTLYRLVRHYYIYGKKTMSIFIIYQLEAQLPMIIQEAEAVMGTVHAFQFGQPIGDGAGALVAAKLMYGAEKRLIAKDTLASYVSLNDRKLIVLKAQGPGGNVGKLGDALERVLDENTGRVSVVIMVDATVKFEGDNTGDVSEGIGAAIGGIGVDKYKIEETVKKHGVPLYAILIKESIQEAYTLMRKDIYKGVDEAINRVRRLVTEKAAVNDLVVVLGVGNTGGIGQ